MTDILCYADSYLKEFDAAVTDATAKGIVLSQTAFYPGGGGQPGRVACQGQGQPDCGAAYAKAVEQPRYVP